MVKVAPAGPAGILSHHMVANGEEILSRLREAKAHLQTEFPIRRLALFGSYARAAQVPSESDIDILVEVEPSIGLGFVTLAEWLEQLLGARVDYLAGTANMLRDFKGQLDAIDCS